ncbi:hypothetical protein P4J12_17865 [Bacillus cereus]|nr:hypothetical protein [Bacillus cereus]
MESLVECPRRLLLSGNMILGRIVEPCITSSLLVVDERGGRQGEFVWKGIANRYGFASGR